MSLIFHTEVTERIFRLCTSEPHLKGNIIASIIQKRRKLFFQNYVNLPYTLKKLYETAFFLVISIDNLKDFVKLHSMNKYNNNLIKHITLLCFIIVSNLLVAQAVTDSNDNIKIENNRVIIDSKITVVADSITTVKDTLKTKRSYDEYAEADSLKYSGKSGFFNVKDNSVGLSGDAQMVYQDLVVEADSLYLDLEEELAYSTGNSMIKQNGEIFLSKDIKMDIDTKQGILENGSGSLDDGFLYGSQIRKIADKVYDVDDGIFTTCDAVEPHFYIKAKKLRVTLGNQLSGKPIVYYVNHIPIMALPFATFTIKKGRHSGFLIPQPGWSSNDGKYIKNIAYYYAYKDYFDSKIALDYMEKRGWNFAINNRYVKRYSFNGNFDFNIEKREYGNNSTNTHWALRADHSQTLKDNASISANINYASSKSIWDSNSDIDKRLTEDLTSSISYSKRFTNSTFSINNSYNQNFITNTKTVTLPSINFSKSPLPIYEMFGIDSKDYKNAWWKSFSYNYSARASHVGSIKEEHAPLSHVIWDNSTDVDSLGNLINLHNAGMKQTLRLSYNAKIFKSFTFTQSVNYYEAWFDKTKDEKGFARGNSYDTNSSVTTTLYGYRKLNLFNLRAVRHIVKPTVRFNFTPDFSENDNLYSFGGVGVQSGSRKRNISFSLSQTWQIKYLDRETEKEKKINNLISWTSSTSYDLEKESKKLSTIGHKLSYSPNSFIANDVTFKYSGSFSFSQDFYEMSFTDMSIDNLSLSHSLTLSGTARYFNYFPQKKNPLKTGERIVKDSLDFASLDWDYYSANSESKNWSLSISNSQTFDNDIFHAKSNSLRISTNLNLTKNWGVTYSNSINLQEGEALSHTIDLKRDLHCWNLTFNYTMSNDYWEYKVLLSNNQLADMLKFPLEGHK